MCLRVDLVNLVKTMQIFQLLVQGGNFNGNFSSDETEKKTILENVHKSKCTNNQFKTYNRHMFSKIRKHLNRKYTFYTLAIISQLFHVPIQIEMA